jgi:hypothetical protein
MAPEEADFYPERSSGEGALADTIIGIDLGTTN